MVKDSLRAALLVAALSAGVAGAQTLPAQQSLSGTQRQPSPRAASGLASTSVADRFRCIAGEMIRPADVTGPQADQAIILLTAAKLLDPQAPVERTLLEVATRHAVGDYSQHVRLWLDGYVGPSADRAVVARAVRYLLDRLDSVAQRQKLLENLVSEIGNRNPVVDSDLALLLGRVTVEQGNLQAAKFYLIQAYTNNKYNDVAFAALSQLAPDEMGPAVYLEHLRLGLRENPLDMDAALNVAQYAEQLQLYELAAGTYGYGAALFRYLYPSDPLPPRIYLPWAIAAYNTDRDQEVCLQIAETIRGSGRFDLMLEAVAGRAAIKMGDPERGRRILTQAQQKAEQLLQGTAGQGQVFQAAGTPSNLTGTQLAWFYCFARPEPVKALEWANEAYAADPNAPAAGALLAYALGMNDRLEWARPLLESLQANQISGIVRAQVQLADGNKSAAVETLTQAIGRDPGSLAAERGKELLRQAGGAYTPPVDPRMLRDVLRENLGDALVPRFLPPAQMLEAQFSTRGSEFSYGDEIEALVAVSNRGVEPLVITDSSLFRGDIRVDAHVSGDLRADIRELVSETIRTDLTVPAGRSLTRSLRLSTGRLGRMLQSHPQATLKIELKLYLDPVTAEDGSIRSRLLDLEPLTVSLTRPGLDLTASYVRNRLNAVSTGQPAQKLRTAQLVTGLLEEEYAMARQGALYPYRSAEWLPQTLRSALMKDSGLLQAEGADAWVVKVNTMADMCSLRLDRELATVVAANLHDREWPVRLMALYLLATSYGGGFDKVLDWTARNDPDDLVRSMAGALRATRATDQ